MTKGTIPEPQRRTMSVEEAATTLGIGRTTAYTQIRQGRFPAPVIRVGKRVVVPVAAVERLLADGTPGTVA